VPFYSMVHLTQLAILNHQSKGVKPSVEIRREQGYARSTTLYKSVGQALLHSLV
jgi:hypothetical protein